MFNWASQRASMLAASATWATLPASTLRFGTLRAACPVARSVTRMLHRNSKDISRQPNLVRQDITCHATTQWFSQKFWRAFLFSVNIALYTSCEYCYNKYKLTYEQVDTIMAEHKENTYSSRSRPVAARETSVSRRISERGAHDVAPKCRFCATSDLAVKCYASRALARVSGDFRRIESDRMELGKSRKCGSASTGPDRGSGDAMQLTMNLPNLKKLRMSAMRDR
jgi:hypothetical protein